MVTVDAADASRPYVVEYSSEYYMLAHFSSFIPPSSRLLASTPSASATAGGLLALAARTADQSVVVQLLNTDSMQPLSVLVRDELAQTCLVATLAPQTLSTFKYGTASPGGGGGLSAGATAAVVVVALVAAAVLAAAAVWLYRRRQSGASGDRRYRGQHDDSMIALSPPPLHLLLSSPASQRAEPTNFSMVEL